MFSLSFRAHAHKLVGSFPARRWFLNTNTNSNSNNTNKKGIMEKKTETTGIYRVYIWVYTGVYIRVEFLCHIPCFSCQRVGP